MNAPMAMRKPGSHYHHLVRAVVVHHQMNLEHLGNIGFDRVQKREELVGTMALMQLADDRSRGDELT